MKKNKFKKNNNKNLIYKILVNKIKKKLKNYNLKNFKPNYDIPTYFASYYNGYGLNFIKKTLGIKNNFFIFLCYIIKDLAYSSNYNDIKLLNNNKKDLFDKIIFTWGHKKNFEKNGSLQDNYFSINSRSTHNTHWVVLFLDKKLPIKIDKNISLIHIVNRKKINFFLILKILISNFKYLILDYQYYLFSISSHNFLSQKIEYFFEILIKKKNKISFICI